MTKRRRRFKQTTSLQERLTSFAQQNREKAQRLPHGRERQDLLKKARQADNTVHLDDLLSLPALQPQD